MGSMALKNDIWFIPIIRGTQAVSQMPIKPSEANLEQYNRTCSSKVMPSLLAAADEGERIGEPQRIVTNEDIDQKLDDVHEVP